MEFDYCELELHEPSGLLQISVGCRFVDEPNELYVIVLDAGEDGAVNRLQLMFNGMDCRYAFKAEESEAVLQYVRTSIAETEYASWFKNSLIYYDDNKK
ncbi:hypothetical protein [Paenibacillus rigui]|uniref:Pullulanase n=1 Tax=Paenibacillus rigui TaxID=554312 RepID=A0A229UYG8_9BACL|nr:hypothetical protein [Paenibacillus rigui]OXM88155.1 hypothetical protein CF651_03440 [Paenibacillus rigui]